MLQDISKLQDELEEAKEDLHQDLLKVQRKAESVEADFEPRNIIGQYPVIALGIAAATGFLLGGGLRSSVGRNLMLFSGRLVVRELVTSAVADARMRRGPEYFRGSGTAQEGGRESSAGPLKSAAQTEKPEGEP